MKLMTLQAPQPLLENLARIIRLYAEAAYPVGGSDCAQAARASMMDSAGRIEQQYDVALQSVAISRRLKSHIKAAIEYHIQLESEQGRVAEAEELAARLLKCLNGERILDEEMPG